MLFDTHAHLDMEAFADDLEEVMQRAREAQVESVLTVGIDFGSSSRAIAIAQEHDRTYAAVGYHPHNAAECTPNDLERLAALSAAPEVVAWGEIGLDYYRGYCPAETQKPLFTRQIEMAADLALPVIIHDREAHMDVLEAVRRTGLRKRRGVIHCFSGDLDLAHTFIDLGFYISIPGTVTFPKATQVREVARGIPLEALLIETDAPYLAPVPKRGKRNEPAFVRYTAGEIASLRGLREEEIARVTTENACRLFGIDQTP
ncbi:TatD family hydrolase [Desulfatiglans anilini]|uniref:TatD family hydrolase n=1 Tax=Desulfatiglans anilini TaxID=90728 RepID=UPI0004109654|nr:TatD family hydrolase [Desulfatiglans anilini]